VFERTIVGNQPKISEIPGRVNLRVARNRFDSGKIDTSQLEDSIRATIRDTITDQIDAGMDRVSDGRIRWDDPVTPFAAAHDGFEIGGLIRFFDNNVYYRRPTIVGPVRFVRSTMTGDFRLARSLTDRPLLASVCGPFSMAKFCVDHNYKDSAKLYMECARLVRLELEALSKAGADWVQLDEPWLGFCPDEVGPATDAIAAAVRGIALKTSVYVYFSPVERVIRRLWDLPVDMIGADCVSNPGNFDVMLDGPSSKGRAFGLVDSRNTRLETVGQLTCYMDKIVKHAGEGWSACWLTPSAALEFLPHRNAMAKMHLLTTAVTQFADHPVAAG
jgi:5-methyltetrahydropteroyltriglutamate--homocysteine methyltransferase